MKQMTKLFISVLLLGSVTSAGAQAYKTHEVSKAPAFHAIEVNGQDIDVHFSQGEEFSFFIKGPAKLRKAAKVKVKEDTLFVEYHPPFFVDDEEEISLYVVAPQLNRIAVSGEADFESTTPFQGQDLTVKTHQNGEVSMKNVTVGRLNIDARGSSSVEIDYIKADHIRVSSLDRAEVELSGSTGQLEIAKKGMFAEINTKKLTTHPINSEAKSSGQATKNGSVEFSFND